MIQVSVSVPVTLFRDVEQIARREGRTKSRLFREALGRYVEDRRWRELRAYSTNRARRLRMTQGDVERAVREFRSGR